MPLEMTDWCTCDDIGDSPCPRHKRENDLENELLKLKSFSAKIRLINQAYVDDCLSLFNQFQE